MLRPRLTKTALADLERILSTSSERWGEPGRLRYAALVADVIRVDRTKAHVMDRLADPKFAVHNRSRRSVSVDLQKKEGVEVEVIDLSRLSSEYGLHIHPCKACFSTAAALCPSPLPRTAAKLTTSSSPVVKNSARKLTMRWVTTLRSGT